MEKIEVKSRMIVSPIKMGGELGAEATLRHVPNGDEYELLNRLTITRHYSVSPVTIRFQMSEVKKLMEFCEAVLKTEEE